MCASVYVSIYSECDWLLKQMFAHSLIRAETKNNNNTGTRNQAQIHAASKIVRIITIARTLLYKAILYYALCLYHSSTIFKKGKKVLPYFQEENENKQKTN